MKKTDDNSAPYQEFARERLGIEFNDINLLITALTHRSYVNEHKNTAKEHNERLEFLGDAVLELVSSDYLFRNYEEPEGIMTLWRSALVRTESIHDAGIELGYEPLIRMSKGEQRGGERARISIVADCFEAVIGAVYIDHGYAAAKRIIEQHILNKTSRMIADGSWRDPKSALQEVSQHRVGRHPIYKVIKAVGPDHDRTFTVQVAIGGEPVGVGEGSSQKEAQAAAARDALKKIRAEEKAKSAKAKKANKK